MDFPPLKNVDFAPFLNVVNQVKGHLTEAIGKINDPAVRDMFSGLLGEMESKQASLEVEAPLWKASAEARYAGVIAKYGEATTKKDALLGQLLRQRLYYQSQFMGLMIQSNSPKKNVRNLECLSKTTL